MNTIKGFTAFLLLPLVILHSSPFKMSKCTCNQEHGAQYKTLSTLFKMSLVFAGVHLQITWHETTFLSSSNMRVCTWARSQYSSWNHIPVFSNLSVCMWSHVPVPSTQNGTTFLSPSNSCVCTCARSQYSVLNNFPVFFEFVTIHLSKFTDVGIKWVSCLLRICPRTRVHVHRTWYWMSFMSSSNSSAYTCARCQYLVINNFPVFFFKLVSVHVHSMWY